MGGIFFHLRKKQKTITDIFFKNLSPAILITNHIIVKVKKYPFSSSISKQLVFKQTCKLEWTNLRKNVSFFFNWDTLPNFSLCFIGQDHFICKTISSKNPSSERYTIVPRLMTTVDQVKIFVVDAKLDIWFPF